MPKLPKKCLQQQNVWFLFCNNTVFCNTQIYTIPPKIIPNLVSINSHNIKNYFFFLFFYRAILCIKHMQSEIHHNSSSHTKFHRNTAHNLKVILKMATFCNIMLLLEIMSEEASCTLYTTSMIIKCKILVIVFVLFEFEIIFGL